MSIGTSGGYSIIAPKSSRLYHELTRWAQDSYGALAPKVPLEDEHLYGLTVCRSGQDLSQMVMALGALGFQPGRDFAAVHVDNGILEPVPDWLRAFHGPSPWGPESLAHMSPKHRAIYEVGPVRFSYKHIQRADITPSEALAQRRRRAMWGLLTGDAVGVPYEFHSPATLPPRAALDIDPPFEFLRAHGDAPVYAWSDDGAQALVLLETLLDHPGSLDLDALAHGLVRWYDEGHLAAYGEVFDIGSVTLAALDRLKQGISAAQAGRTDEMSNGNGSLMRVLPLALVHTDRSDEELVAMAGAQSKVTHGHPVAQICCATYTLVAAQLLRGEGWEPAWSHAEAVATATWPGHASRVFGARDIGRGRGYVVSTLWSAKEAVERANSFEDAVLNAVAMGHDTDTTAAVAGGLAGLLFEQLPLVWVSKLADKARAKSLIDRLA